MSRYTADYKSIIRLAVPILAGQLGNIVVGFADNIMVGQYKTDAFAAVGFVNNVFNIVLLAVLGFTFGLTPIVGAMFARDEKSAIGATMRSGLYVNVVYALLMTAVMGVIYFYVDRFGQPAHLLPYIRPYYLIYLAGLLPVCVFNVFAQWSYAIGNTRLPMAIILTANVLNIAGNYVLIFGKCGFPELGIVGAGLSTLFARLFTAAVIVAVFFFSRRYRDYSVSFRSSRIDRARSRNVLETGFPVSMQSAFETAAFSGAAVMAGWISTESLAAFQIILITGTLGFCIYYSFGSATAVLVSHAAGLHDTHGMRRVAWAGYHVMLVVMSCSCLVFLLWGRDIMGFFSNDAGVTRLAGTLIFPLLLYQIADATQINFVSALRGTSRVRPMLMIAFVSYIVLGLPSTYFFSETLGMELYGIVLSFSVSLVCAAILFLYYFLRATRSPQR